MQSNKECMLINLLEIQIITKLSGQSFVELAVETKHLSSQHNLCQIVEEDEIFGFQTFFFLMNCTLKPKLTSTTSFIVI